MSGNRRSARLAAVLGIAVALAVLVPDAAAAANNSDPHDLTAVGDTLFFTAWDSDFDRELWKTDGTPSGTQRVVDLRADGSSDPESLVAFQGMLYFSADDGSGRALFRSDGDVVDLVKAGLAPERPTVAGDTLFFFIGFDLWASDGTADGTGFVESMTLPGDPEDWTLGPATAVGSRLYFVIQDFSVADLWKSDGTPAGTQRVKRIQAPPNSDYQYPDELTALGGRLLFARVWENAFGEGPQQAELWRTWGTPVSTKKVKDLRPERDSVLWLTRMGDRVYFAGADAGRGTELWRTDGTAAGTRRVRDIIQGSDSSNPSLLTRVGDRIFFRIDVAIGWELWMSDGTAAGTVFVADRPRELQFSESEKYRWAAAGGRLFFSQLGSGGFEPWVSNGTAAGTHRLKNVRPGSLWSYPSWFTPAGSLMYFVAHDGAHGRELWVSDGTGAGTRLLRDINED